MKNKKLADTL